MSTERNVPKLRFPGFTEPWEQRKCEGILRPEKGAMKIGPFGSALKKEFYTEVGVKVYAQENIFQEDFSIGNYYISDERYQTLKGCKLEAGDLVISMMGTIGACAIFPEDAEPGIMNSHLLRLQLKDDIYPEYIHQLLRDSQLIRKQIDRLSVGSIMSGLSTSVVQKLVFPVPCIEEQKKIAEFLVHIDNLITLHQRKLKHVKDLKKSMLQKMFPKNGQEYPELRFPGFTEPWEQRKLGDDLVSIHTGTNLLGSITNTGMPLIKMGNIQRGYFDTSKVEFLAENEQPDKADIVNYGDFFFNTRNTLELVGKGATWMKNSGEYAFNSNIARFELRNLDTIFFNYLYNTDYMTKQIHARAMGTTSVAAIYPRTLDSVEYLAPCMKEQQKIGAYFKQLDHLITLHQRELEHFKLLKKGMLQQMFV